MHRKLIVVPDINNKRMDWFRRMIDAAIGRYLKSCDNSVNKLIDDIYTNIRLQKGTVPLRVCLWSLSDIFSRHDLRKKLPDGTYTMLIMAIHLQLILNSTYQKEEGALNRFLMYELPGIRYAGDCNYILEEITDPITGSSRIEKSDDPPVQPRRQVVRRRKG